MPEHGLDTLFMFPAAYWLLLIRGGNFWFPITLTENSKAANIQPLTLNVDYRLGGTHTPFSLKGNVGVAPNEDYRRTTFFNNYVEHQHT